MNSNIVIAGVAVAIVIIGGLVYYKMEGGSLSNTNATSTPIVLTDNDKTPTPSQTRVAGVPVATTKETVSVADTTVVVSGSVNPNGAFTNYWYEFGTNGNLGTKSSSQTVGSGYIAIGAPAYITGLTKDTTYYFRLMAQNEFGKVAGNQYSFVTTHGVPSPVGSVPSVKTSSATGISRNTVNLNGEVNPNKASTQHWFEYGKTANLGNTSALASIGDGSNKVSASISLSGLDPLTTYYFRLNAQNQFGTVNGSILNFTTQGPASASKPSAVTEEARTISASSASLRGSVDPKGLDTTYWFEYSTDSLLGAVLLSTTPQKSLSANAKETSVTGNISGLSPSTTYYFRLIAQNNQGLVRGNLNSFKTD